VISFFASPGKTMIAVSLGGFAMQPLISTRHGGHVDWTRHDRSRSDQAVVSRSFEGRKPVVSVSGVSVAPHDFNLNSSTRTHSESTANRRDRQTRYLLLTKDVVCVHAKPVKVVPAAKLGSSTAARGP
jgi:hypothetical protein